MTPLPYRQELPSHARKPHNAHARKRGGRPKPANDPRARQRKRRRKRKARKRTQRKRTAARANARGRMARQYAGTYADMLAWALVLDCACSDARALRKRTSRSHTRWRM